MFLGSLILLCQVHSWAIARFATHIVIPVPLMYP